MDASCLTSAFRPPPTPHSLQRFVLATEALVVAGSKHLCRFIANFTDILYMPGEFSDEKSALRADT